RALRAGAPPPGAPTPQRRKPSPADAAALSPRSGRGSPLAYLERGACHPVGRLCRFRFPRSHLEPRSAHGPAVPESPAARSSRTPRHGRARRAVAAPPHRPPRRAAPAAPRRAYSGALPAEVSRRAQREMDRLRRLPTGSPEAAQVRAYLQWLWSTPWESLAGEDADLRHVQAELEQEHLGLSKA